MGKIGQAKTEASGSGSLRRGLAILRTLHQSGSSGLPVADIARMTGLPRPSVYRLLDALVEEHFVQPVMQGKRFVSVIPEALRGFERWDGMVRRLQPIMQSLAAETGSTVYLVRRIESDACCLHREFGDYPIQVNSMVVGARQPLGVGAGGMALLAAHTDEEVEEILEGSAARLHRYGGMTAQTMRALVKSTRVRGYSVVGNFAVKGVLGTGVAVYDKRGRPVAAISVSSILERMSTAKQRAIAARLRAEIKPI